MIDTVGFRAELTQRQYDLLFGKSKIHSGFDTEKAESLYRILKKDISIGSYDSKITIRAYEDLTVDFQFSLPKQYYGNNNQLLPCRLVEAAMSRVYDGLRGGVWRLAALQGLVCISVGLLLRVAVCR